MPIFHSDEQGKNYEMIHSKLKRYGQEHILDNWIYLDEVERNLFLRYISTLDLSRYHSYYLNSAANPSFTNPNQASGDDIQNRMQPPLAEDYFSTSELSDDEIAKYRNKGLEAIAKGQVAVILLAGGQGTRLGSSNPKGMFDVGLPSKKTLFQLQAERIVRLQDLALQACGEKKGIKWYIMCSDATIDQTENYFKQNNFFSLGEANVIFIKQQMIPTFDFNGKLMMETYTKLCLAPDGNGGLYYTLREHNVVLDMQEMGIKYVHVYCVDNILVKVADPDFIGCCIVNGCDCGAKVTEKKDASEAVGVVCRLDEKYQVVEYSEINEEIAKLRQKDGKLAYRAGNICNHFFSIDFLEKIIERYNDELEFHVAKKKIPVVDNDTARAVKPQEPNGIKLEKFIFDVFRFSQKFAVYEVERQDEFSPLKNASGSGKDCAETCKADLKRVHVKWLENVGASVVNSEAEQTEVEISPLRSYAGEALEDKKGMELKSPVIIE